MKEILRKLEGLSTDINEYDDTVNWVVVHLCPRDDSENPPSRTGVSVRWQT